MSSSKAGSKAIDNKDSPEFNHNHQDAQAKKKIKILLKKPACMFTNRPKEVILIRGRDPACKQTLTFRQQEIIPRAVNVPKVPQNVCDLTGWDTNTLPERPRTPAAVRPERPRELVPVVEEDESGRNRKKSRRTLEE